MQIELETLSDDPEILKTRMASLIADHAQQVNQFQHQLDAQRQALSQRDTRIEHLLDVIELLKRKRFAASSERVSKDQLGLFDEAELETLIRELEEALEQRPHTQSKETPDKAKPRRRPLPAHLVRVETVIDLPQAEQAAMEGEWVLIGYDQCEQLATIPRQYYVKVTKRAKYAPVNAQVAGAEDGIRIAPRAAQMLPKSLADSSLLADVVTRKFVDHLPLYRQEQILGRAGIEIPRCTMAGWMIQLADRLEPLAVHLKALLHEAPNIHIDETVLQVLKEPGRENTQKSYMWVFRGGPPQAPVVFYHYASSRGGAVPKEFLFPSDPDPGYDPPRGSGFYIQTDGYAGYNELARMEGVRGHAACWAHVRRGFVDAAKGRAANAPAHEMVSLIGKLYRIERAIRGRSVEQRRAARENKAKPILDKIKVWLDAKVQTTLPKGLLGQAIHYALSLWPDLLTYLEDGHLEIDNNLVENAIRPFVVGRKAWMFSGSPRGAEASALLYSLVETAKANRLEPWAYLNYLFEHYPAAKTAADIQALLPHNLKGRDLKAGLASSP